MQIPKWLTYFWWFRCLIGIIYPLLIILSCCNFTWKRPKCCNSGVLLFFHVYNSHLKVFQYDFQKMASNMKLLIGMIFMQDSKSLKCQKIFFYFALILHASSKKFQSHNLILQQTRISNVFGLLSWGLFIIKYFYF